MPYISQCQRPHVYHVELDCSFANNSIHRVVCHLYKSLACGICKKYLSVSTQMDSQLTIECFSFNSNGKHGLIGKFQKTVVELEKLHSNGQGEYLLSPTATGHNHHDEVLKSHLFANKFCECVQHTFLDYLSNGYELNFMIAIDFTASNGNPRLPDSLLYIDQPFWTAKRIPESNFRGRRGIAVL
ncbi:Protein BONZAI like [Actinidia chinensis var. chinensis]|uniref:Protein BONZAI like n=1 Tax=Actinidia chinensis var. chinensis TaxID=1590841 RepID=A0A2R6QG57_ACTCC|nr:Protein BONZAI like [Actinidia chinensis var. chinensis]